MLRNDPHRGQFDLFVPYLADLPLRDQRETMERPFFALAKRKRLKPIEYTSPDGKTWVQVTAPAQFGIATIWDADILIWAASTLNAMREKGCNDLPRTLHFHPYDLLRAIGRDTGGREYKLLTEALDRLRSTNIKTSIRTEKRKRGAAFGWLDSWDYDETGDDEKAKGMHLTLSNWIYEGILNEGGILAIHPDYFRLTGGLERALYRIARKHAGKQPQGFTCSIETLHAKTGSDSSPKKFGEMLRKIITRDGLPEYHLRLLTDSKGKAEAVKMIRRADVCVSR